MTENVRDQVVPILGLLETPKSHLCAGNVLFRVLEIFKLQFFSTSPIALSIFAYQCVLLPFNPFSLVCVGV